MQTSNVSAETDIYKRDLIDFFSFFLSKVTLFHMYSYLLKSLMLYSLKSYSFSILLIQYNHVLFSANTIMSF